MLRINLNDGFELDDFERMLAINVKGSFVAIEEALHYMPKGGRIINIGSVSSEYTPINGLSVYSSTKGACQHDPHACSRSGRRRHYDQQRATRMHRHRHESNEQSDRRPRSQHDRATPLCDTPTTWQMRSLGSRARMQALSQAPTSRSTAAPVRDEKRRSRRCQPAAFCVGTRFARCVSR